MIGEKKENSSYNPFTNSIVVYIFFPQYFQSEMFSLC